MQTTFNLLCLSISLLSVNAVNNPVSCTCGSSTTRQRRIVGGERAAIEKFPWMATLRIVPTFVSCGAAVISNCFVLTSAHCFKRERKPHVSVIMGTDQYKYKQAVVRMSAELIRHPSYSVEYLHDDIMLIKLDKPVKFNSDIQPICLPSSRDYTGEIATVMGFGSVAYGGNYSNVMKAVNLPIISNRKCQKAFKSRILDTNLCAGGEEGKDACQGDSGGPLVFNNKGIYSLLGTVSWGKHCASKGVPGVYTKVAAYIDWIKNVTSQSSHCCRVLPGN